jgi:acyl-CoA thioester hydrolase
MPQPFTTQRLVEFSDTDMAGIMHFAAFFRYMESVEHEFVRHLGFSVHSEIDGQVISFPRVAAKCDFRSPARCEDLLDAELVVRRIGNTSITYRTVFSREGQPVAEGEVTCVCCRIVPGAPPQPVPVPAEIARRMKDFLDPAAE